MKKFLSILSSSLILTSSIASLSGSNTFCSSNDLILTAQFEGHQYALIDTPMSWKSANTSCQSKGGHLVTITSPEENEFVKNLISHGTKSNYWLGATDEKNEGNWKWVNDDPFLYSNWQAGSGGDNAGGNEDFLMMYNRKNPIGTWNDIGEKAGSGSCDLKNFGFVCEWDNNIKVQTNTDDWSKKHSTLRNTTDAELMSRTGDIDNLNFGWPQAQAYNVFSGKTTPKHAYPWNIDSSDPSGTDRIMVSSSYTGKSGQNDGYTKSTARPNNLVQTVNLNYDMSNIKVKSAILQVFIDGLNSKSTKAKFEFKINNTRIDYIENVINSVKLDSTGCLLNFKIADQYLPLIASGNVSISIDDTTTGIGDGYAVDFARLLINPKHESSLGKIYKSNNKPSNQTNTNTQKQQTYEAPTNLKAEASNKKVTLTWNKPNNYSNLIGYNLYRGTSLHGETSTPVSDFLVKNTSHVDLNVENGTTYYYICKAVYKDNKESTASNEICVTPKASEITVVFQVNNRNMYINNVKSEIDPGKGTTPLIYNSRSYTPLRALIEAIGGTVTYDSSQKKITILVKSDKLELWVGNKTALVNGISKTNDVAPQIFNSRTMLPIRFVTDNIKGCSVVWDSNSRTITIHYLP